MDEIITNEFHGNFVKKDGICYFFATETTEFANVSDDGFESFDSCEDCLDENSSSSSEFVSFAGLDYTGAALGDPHMVYIGGGSGNSNAAFNVDDNDGTDEILFFSSINNTSGNEINLYYSCQGFDYTSGGISINYIKIVDGGVTDIYDFNATQNQARKNGANFIGETRFLGNNVIEVNIARRIINGAASGCPMANPDFGLFDLNLQIRDGAYNEDEIGGAFYYIMKQLGSEGPGPVNNSTSAGYDGIGAYLNGLDGYTARTQFETANIVGPGDVRETVSSGVLGDVASKLIELDTVTTGSVNFDWDPLMSGVVICPDESSSSSESSASSASSDSSDSSSGGVLATCGTPNADPTINMTVSWIDADVTKNWLGCTWTNGETKVVYASTYNDIYQPPNTTNTFFPYGRYWRKNWNKNGQFFMGRNFSTFDAPYPTTYIDHSGANMYISPVGSPGNILDYFTVNRFIGTYTVANLGILSTGDRGALANVNLNQPNFMPNSFTDSNNITYTWTEGNGW
jgi:hypothetical protein